MQAVDIFGIVVVLGLVGLSIVWHFSRSASLLRQWAEENGYLLVHSEYRYFFWTTSNGQAVYRVRARRTDSDQGRLPRWPGRNHPGCGGSRAGAVDEAGGPDLRPRREPP